MSRMFVSTCAANHESGLGALFRHGELPCRSITNHHNLHGQQHWSDQAAFCTIAHDVPSGSLRECKLSSLTLSGRSHNEAVLMRPCFLASCSTAVFVSSLAFAGFLPACPRSRSSALLLCRQPLGSGILREHQPPHDDICLAAKDSGVMRSGTDTCEASKVYPLLRVLCMGAEQCANRP